MKQSKKPMLTDSGLHTKLGITRKLFESIRKRPKFDCVRVTAEIATDDLPQKISAEELEEAERRFKAKWEIEKAFKDAKMYIPADGSTLKLLYGMYSYSNRGRTSKCKSPLEHLQKQAYFFNVLNRKGNDFETEIESNIASSLTGLPAMQKIKIRNKENFHLDDWKTDHILEGSIISNAGAYTQRNVAASERVSIDGIKKGIPLTSSDKVSKMFTRCLGLNMQKKNEANASERSLIILATTKDNNTNRTERRSKKAASLAKESKHNAIITKRSRQEPLVKAGGLEKIIKAIERLSLRNFFTKLITAETISVEVVKGKSPMQDKELKARAFYGILEGLVNMSLYRRFLLWNHFAHKNDELEVVNKRKLKKGLSIIKTCIMRKTLKNCIKYLKGND